MYNARLENEKSVFVYVPNVLKPQVISVTIKTRQVPFTRLETETIIVSGYRSAAIVILSVLLN